MSTSDGRVIGTTQIVNHGPASRRWNLLIMPDGYREPELPAFAADADGIAAALLAARPFNQLRRAINVFRADVASTDSGADDPLACGGTGATAATYFDAAFCNDGIRRLLLVNERTALAVARAQLPQFHMALVVVNSTVDGGSGGSVAVISKAPGTVNVALHEIGHAAFQLADEYGYFEGCGSNEAGRDTYAGPEPAEPNVTANADRAAIKWAGLISAATPVPTTQNADCSDCDPQPNPHAVGTVGAFEGAHHFHCGVYRPEFNCRMREIDAPFCAVCRERIRRVLTPFLP